MSKFQIPEDLCGVSLTVNDVEKIFGIGHEESYVVCNGRVVSRTQPLQPGLVYHIVPRVLGGKGGFGSMLRAIGAQIEKTTSREACRDLSGRRIRDVNNEKKLKEWVSKQADRERAREEREERRRAKRAKYLDDTPSRMNNPEYDAQYSEIMKQSEQAIQEGLAKLKEGPSTSRKRKAESSSSSALDKYDRWNITGGVEIGDLDSDSGSEDSSSNDSDSKAGPSSSCHDPAVTSSSSSPSSSSQGPAASPKRAAHGSPSATVTSSDTSGQVEDAPPSKIPRLDVSRSEEEVSSSSGDHPTESSCEGCKSSSGADPSLKTEQLSENKVSNGAVSGSEESTEPINLEDFTSSEDLETLGLERLKADLMRRGVKCGGSLQERAQRLFSIKGLSADEIPAKLLAKGKGQGKSSRK